MYFSSANEKLIFFNFPVLLFSLIPFFLITGPFLSDLAVSLISLLFLIFCFKEKNFYYFKNKYFYFFLAFCSYLLINSLINNYNLDSLKISLFYFRYGIFVIAIYALLKTDDNFVKYFFYCIFICFTALIFDGFYQYFIGENILGWKNSSRTSSFFGDEHILGSYLSRLWPLFFGLSIFFMKKKNKFFFLFILAFILSETLIFLSGDRSAFFNINLSAIFVILFSRKLLKLRLLTVLSSFLLLIIITFINPTAKERLIDNTLVQMNLDEESKGEQKYIFSKNHHGIYASAYKMYIDNKILGVGIKNFRNICKDPRYYVNEEINCNSHPHNTYVQILAETGIIGFSFLLFVLIYFCKFLIKHIISIFKGRRYFNDFEICILSGIAIYLWPFVPTGNVFSNWLNIALIINLPFLIFSRNSNKT